MIDRNVEKLVKKYAIQFRAIALVGPRQSGKSTLVRKVFPKKKYVSLENPDERLIADSDPKGFLNRYKKTGAIIDEVQRVPKIFNYLQQILDEQKKDGFFILTGSNNFLLQQSISQSLAGRIGYIDLLPLDLSEINLFNNSVEDINELILQGSYPEIYDKKRDPNIWYPSYIRTYVERDVKQIRNIDNSILFNRFLQLCAGRIGQQLSVASLSNDAGIDVKTTNSWLSILQASYIIHLLPPHHKNFNKRVVKSPKLYFIDTGLACALLGIRNTVELNNSHFRGALFENFSIIEFLKKKFNTGSQAKLYYWRDNKGVEIDLLIDSGAKLFPIEIKSAQTFTKEHLKNINLWNKYREEKGGMLIYNGDMEYTNSDKIQIQRWNKLSKIRISTFR